MAKKKTEVKKTFSAPVEDVKAVVVEPKVKIDDKKLNAELQKKVTKVPEKPKGIASMGDLSPEVLGWYKKYRPAEYKLKFEKRVEKFSLKVKE